MRKGKRGEIGKMKARMIWLEKMKERGEGHKGNIEGGRKTKDGLVEMKGRG